MATTSPVPRRSRTKRSSGCEWYKKKRLKKEFSLPGRAAPLVQIHYSTSSWPGKLPNKKRRDKDFSEEFGAALSTFLGKKADDRL